MDEKFKDKNEKASEKREWFINHYYAIESWKEQLKHLLETHKSQKKDSVVLLKWTNKLNDLIMMCANSIISYGEMPGQSIEEDKISPKSQIDNELNSDEKLVKKTIMENVHWLITANPFSEAFRTLIEK